MAFLCICAVVLGLLVWWAKATTPRRSVIRWESEDEGDEVPTEPIPSKEVEVYLEAGI